MTYLIDTDWVIGHFRQVERITTRLGELVPEGLAISIITLAELYEGVFYSRDPVQSEAGLREFLNPELAILPLDDEVCQIFGRERGRLRREGRIIGDSVHLLASQSHSPF